MHIFIENGRNESKTKKLKYLTKNESLAEVDASVKITKKEAEILINFILNLG